MLEIAQMRTKSRRKSMAWNPARMKLLRLKRKMTQKRLAEIIGATYQQIQDYERGKHEPTISRAHEIAKALSTATSYLVGEVDDPEAILFLSDLTPTERKMILARKRRDFEALSRLAHKEVTERKRK